MGVKWEKEMEEGVVLGGQGLLLQQEQLYRVEQRVMM